MGKITIEFSGRNDVGEFVVSDEMAYCLFHLLVQSELSKDNLDELIVNEVAGKTDRPLYAKSGRELTLDEAVQAYTAGALLTELTETTARYRTRITMAIAAGVHANDQSVALQQTVNMSANLLTIWARYMALVNFDANKINEEATYIRYDRRGNVVAESKSDITHHLKRKDNERASENH